MKRAMWFLPLLICGCSTHPGADFLDFFCPPPMPAGIGRGGVCNPATPITTPQLPATAPGPVAVEPPPTEAPPTIPR
jgi:hypothetical protein